jgi:hypothetical protein
MRQQARVSAREIAPRGSDRSATNHNTLQARETAANRRPHDRMGRQQNAVRIRRDTPQRDEASIRNRHRACGRKGQCVSSWHVSSVPRMDRHGSYRRVTRPPGEIGKTAVHNAPLGGAARSAHLFRSPRLCLQCICGSQDRQCTIDEQVRRFISRRPSQRGGRPCRRHRRSDA